MKNFFNKWFKQWNFLGLVLTFLFALVIAWTCEATPMIGLYEDEMATDCAITLEPYTTSTTYIAVSWDIGELENGITAAEFALDGLPHNEGYPIGTVVVTPIGTDLVIGDVWTDYSIAWSEPQGAEKRWFVIALVEITPFVTTWVNVDQVVQVVDGDVCDCLVVVDHVFNTLPAYGECSWLMPSQEWPCGYTAVEETSWSSVKALF